VVRALRPPRRGRWLAKRAMIPCRTYSDVAGRVFLMTFTTRAHARTKWTHVQSRPNASYKCIDTAEIGARNTGRPEASTGRRRIGLCEEGTQSVSPIRRVRRRRHRRHKTAHREARAVRPTAGFAFPARGFLHAPANRPVFRISFSTIGTDRRRVALRRRCRRTRNAALNVLHPVDGFRAAERSAVGHGRGRTRGPRPARGRRL
jgi:hypothetical protein